MYKYRPEIDGLRAIAVLAVVFYHANFKIIQGGNFGVDIFFVISGYLITSDIVKRMENNSFSILDFWQRRIKRIYPMLVFILITSLPFSLLLIPNKNIIDYSNSFISSILSISNLYFWTSTDYFSPSVREQPLIHTWSLSVEEQFYLIFPLIFIIVKKSNKYKFFIVLFTLLSFSYANFTYFNSNYLSNFYLITSRAWEILVGAIIALLPNRNKIPNKLTEIYSISGFFLILISIFFIPDRYFHVSFSTLFPVLGTALIISFRSEIIYKLLSHPLFLKLGTISYSLYLLHQPIFSFLTIYNTNWLNINSIKFFVILCTIILSLLTFNYIEKPFRYNKKNPKQVLSYLIICILSIIAIGIYLKKYATNHYYQNNITNGVNCKSELDSLDGVSCIKIGEGKNKIVILGDSHADSLSKSTINFNQKDYTIYYISKYGCPPLLGIKRYDNIGNSKFCDQFSKNTEMFDKIFLLNPHSIILVARWTIYINGWHKKGIIEPSHHRLKNIYNINEMQSLSVALPLTIDKISSKGINTYILEQVPDLQMFGDNIILNKKEVPKNSIMKWHEHEIKLLKEIDKNYPSSVIWTKKMFCRYNVCTISAENPYYSDDNHLSKYGVNIINPFIKKVIEKNN